MKTSKMILAGFVYNHMILLATFSQRKMNVINWENTPLYSSLWVSLFIAVILNLEINYVKHGLFHDVMIMIGLYHWYLILKLVSDSVLDSRYGNRTDNYDDGYSDDEDDPSRQTGTGARPRFTDRSSRGNRSYQRGDVMRRNNLGKTG